MKKIKEPKNLYNINPMYYDASNKRFLIKTYEGWFEINLNEILDSIKSK
jgi:hypothetical protein